MAVFVESKNVLFSYLYNKLHQRWALKARTWT